MKQPRDSNLFPDASPADADTSDLVDLKAIAASTRASAAPPVVSAAELSGVVARRDSVVGARVVQGGSGIPPWFWGVIGCLGVMALGLGIFGYLTAPARAPSLPDFPAKAPANFPSPASQSRTGPEIVPLPPRSEPTINESARIEKEKAAAHRIGVGKITTHASTASVVRQEGSDTIAEEPAKKPNLLDSLLASAPEGPGVGGNKKREARVVAVVTDDDSAPDDSDRARKDVDAALEDLQPKMHECFRRYQIRGIAKVKLIVSPNGSVEAPALTGGFEGTPTGDCVIKELASAALRPFKGGPVNVSHAYVFR